jgi:hypothetical protein
MAVFREIHNNWKNTLCGQNVEFLSVNVRGTRRKTSALKRFKISVLCTTFVQNMNYHFLIGQHTGETQA